MESSSLRKGWIVFADTTNIAAPSAAKLHSRTSGTVSLHVTHNGTVNDFKTFLFSDVAEHFLNALLRIKAASARTFGVL
ncbi:unnamed protein product [Schistosoma curassoni]|uniref:Uncharacterized protein n=1 Tax=Schistosoma curassoni TaxID=6186 RepID=A0A183L460_9TREM|nr:unnamed protein product [Schistosoma curassoni]